MAARRPRLAPLALALGFALAASAAHAVNLVPNPSFESYVNCPFTFGQANFATGWDVPNTGTSDYYNTCAAPVFPSVNVPYTQLGYRPALTGSGYCGIIPYSSAPDYREYLQIQLTSPLVAGQPYLVQFHVSLADTSLYAVDRIGAYLSVGAVGPVPNYAPLPFTPQVESPANVALNDYIGWTLISGIVVANGGEDHLVIGSFRDDASTDATPGPDTWPGYSYYFIEDVSVELSVPTEQACCMSDGSCSIQFPGECTYLGGTPAGPGTSCQPDPCQPTKSRTATWGAVKQIYR